MSIGWYVPAPRYEVTVMSHFTVSWPMATCSPSGSSPSSPCASSAHVVEGVASGPTGAVVTPLPETDVWPVRFTVTQICGRSPGAHADLGDDAVPSLDERFVAVPFFAPPPALPWVTADAELLQAASKHAVNTGAALTANRVRT